MAAGFAKYLNDDWATINDDERKEAIESAKISFRLLVSVVDSKFSLCVDLVSMAYEANGDIEKVENYLTTAKSQMRDLSDQYSDYEHYPALKGYFTTTSSYFNFCQDPQGTFEQLKSTLENYRNNARDYNSDLDYIFVD